MRPAYLSRVLSAPRPQLCVVLGGAGLVLATALLLLATPGSTAGRAKSALASQPNGTAHELNRSAFLFLGFEHVMAPNSARPPAYAFANVGGQLRFAALLPEPGAYRPAPRRAGPHQPYPPTVADTLSGVQRSWNTIKQMFR